MFRRKAKNQRVKRALTKREPKLIENDKQTMIIKGGNTSEIVTSCLKDIVCIPSYYIDVFV